MKVLFYDCFAGISGDMNLGALIDLGVEKDYLESELRKLNIEGFHLDVKTDQRKGITGTKAEVIIENPENEKHRHLRHIEELINSSSLSEKVKKDSIRIFDIVAEAEAKVHNIDKQKVHFHEVGALDSIADIVGAAICIDRLAVDKIISSPVQLGGGTVKCDHGVMPVPAPATALIVENIPIRTGLVNHEATTPTGAAILVAMVDEFSDRNELLIKKTGYGIGNRDSDVPNVLRVHLCEVSSDATDTLTAQATVLECNIDDMNPEHFDYLLDNLFDAGASDAWISQVIMKKSRPASTLSVLCDQERSNEMKEIIFRHSTTIGVREFTVTKSMLKREEDTVDTVYGQVRIKKSFYAGKLIRIKPETDDCRKLAKTHGISISEIERTISNTLENHES